MNVLLRVLKNYQKMIHTTNVNPSTQNDYILQNAQALIDSAKEREIKKQKAIIEIRKALSSTNSDWD